MTSAECYDKPVWTLGELLRVLPELPAHLRAVLPTLWDRPISGRLREAIMLAVATENRCWYCQTAHAIMGESAGLEPDGVRALLAGEDGELPEDERHALAYVRDLAHRGFRSRSEALRGALGERFSPGACEAIEATAHVMNFANRFGNTFDAARHRLRGRCDQSSASAADLFFVSSVFVPAALGVLPVVGMLALANRLRRHRRPCHLRSSPRSARTLLSVLPGSCRAGSAQGSRFSRSDPPCCRGTAR